MMRVKQGRGFPNPFTETISSIPQPVHSPIAPSNEPRINENTKSLEARYHVHLTGKWSEQDLLDFEATMKLIKNEKFTIENPQLSTIRLENLPPGVGGYNYGNGLITIRPGDIKQSLLHEIGHGFENENPSWNEFQKISGWKNITKQFFHISKDYDSTGAYRPYNGMAIFREDGKPYRDGQQIDLDKNGEVDERVQIHSGMVFVHNANAEFVSQYAHTDPKEDFAETFEEFFRNPAFLKKECPKKFQFMVDFAGYDPTATAVERPLIKI